MAIGTNAIVDFFGTQDDVYATTAQVNSAAFSAEGEDWTNDDDAPEAMAVFTGTFAAAPAANRAVHLYARRMNIDTTNDDAAPSANHRASYVGTFIVDNAATQTNSIRIPLDNAETSQVYQFEIENDTDQNLNAGWDLFITPIAPGPHA